MVNILRNLAGRVALNKVNCLSLHRNRDLAQLVAHYVRDVGVGRSSRLIPTLYRARDD